MPLVYLLTSLLSFANYATPQEEIMMCEFFGQANRQYMQRTNRIFPLVNFGAHAGRSSLFPPCE